VSLCIEGIPYHAHQPSTNRHLLTQGTLLKIIDHHHYNVNDAQCCCIIVWARTPDTIAKEVGFWLEEISDRPSVAWHFADFNEASQPHTCHVRVLNYEAIIHIDQIIDYRPPTGHPQTSLSNIRSDGSLASTMTGHCCHRTDPSRSASPPPPNKRDRSPPGDGGEDGTGNSSGNARQLGSGSHRGGCQDMAVKGRCHHRGHDPT
jgi:hypothetical protein